MDIYNHENLMTLLARQAKLHPNMEAQDLVKYLYQACYGPGHLRSEKEVMERYLMEEYENTKAKRVPLFEQVGNDFIRINMARWKREGYPLSWLFNMFYRTLDQEYGNDEAFKALTKEAKKAVKEGIFAFDLKDFEEYLKQYLEKEIHPVHHSETYRKRYSPSYRLVRSEYQALFPVLARIAKRDQKNYVIAIDGPCTSGKSTLGELLSEVLAVDCIHMDDFFLPLNLRTSERMAEAGGNVHYERFIEEVLPNLKHNKDFTYRLFECGDIMDFAKEPIKVRGNDLHLIEGSYASHPKFGRYMDLFVYTDIDPKTQLERVMKRNGPKMYEKFRDLWIPLENKYFKTFNIKKKADIRL
jgi:uridine kinase